MRDRIAYLMIGVIGLTVMLIGGYSEWTSIDLARHSLGEYVNQQFGMRVWWDVVGISVRRRCLPIGAPSREAERQSAERTYSKLARPRSR
jgi:hypothetical protein